MKNSQFPWLDPYKSVRNGLRISFNVLTVSLASKACFNGRASCFFKKGSTWVGVMEVRSGGLNGAGSDYHILGNPN